MFDSNTFAMSWCESLWLDPDRDASGRLYYDNEDEDDEYEEDEDFNDDYFDEEI